MKTKTKILTVLLIFILLGATVLTACVLSKTNINDNISEYSKHLFFGENEDAYVTVTTGTRENPYEYDGISNEKIDFFVVNTVFKTNTDQQTISSKIKIADKEYDLTLEKNPFKSSFMADLQLPATIDTKISLVLNEKEIILSNKDSAFQITSEKALEVAINSLSEEIKSMTSKNKFNGEGYLKIINNPLQNPELYYWYFSVKGQNGKTYSLIIDTNSGEVLAKY